MSYSFLETSNLSIPQLNKLRQFLLSNIPTLAICRTDILHNNSNIIDDILASRLYTIPIINYNNINIIDKTNCECHNNYCEKCTYIVDFKSTYVGNINTNIINKNCNNFILHPDINICYNYGTIDLKLYICKSTGRNNSIWNHLNITIVENKLLIETYTDVHLKYLLNSITI